MGPFHSRSQLSGPDEGDGSHDFADALMQDVEKGAAWYIERSMHGMHLDTHGKSCIH